MSSVKLFPDSPIEFLKGVGPQKAIAVKEQLNIRTLEDLIEYFPFTSVTVPLVVPSSMILTPGIGPSASVTTPKTLTF